MTWKSNEAVSGAAPKGKLDAMWLTYRVASGCIWLVLLSVYVSILASAFMPSLSPFSENMFWFFCGGLLVLSAPFSFIALGVSVDKGAVSRSHALAAGTIFVLTMLFSGVLFFIASYIALVFNLGRSVRAFRREQKDQQRMMVPEG